MIAPFRILFAYAGRLPPRGFVVAAMAIYLAGIATHLLTEPTMFGRGGLWSFILAQATLTWMWFAVHAKRLRDAGYAIGPAAGVALVYLLSVMLLLIVAAGFFNTAAAPVKDPNAASALTFLFVLTIHSILLGGSDYGVVWAVLTVLIVIALVPPVIALVFSVWAATRPSLAASAA